MSIELIEKCIQKIGSSDSLQDWDNTGILINSNTPSTANKKVLICIDFNLEVLNECIDNDIKYVISYHPCIFHPIKKINNELYIKCIQNYISVYSPHTLLDNFMNSYLKTLLGENPGNFDKIILKMKEISSLKQFRIVRSRKAKIYKNDQDIHFGVGAAFRNVKFENCLLITGEMSHHDLLKCKENNVDVIMLEHSNSERIILPEIKRLLENDQELKEFKIIQSSKDLDPVEIV